MKRWKKIVIFALILVLPISMWASGAMASHCQMSDTSSHPTHSQMDDHVSSHANDRLPSPESNDHSNCECDYNLNCSVSGCSVTALINGISINPKLSNQTEYQFINSHIAHTDPDQLFRPPISIS